MHAMMSDRDTGRGRIELHTAEYSNPGLALEEARKILAKVEPRWSPDPDWARAYERHSAYYGALAESLTALESMSLDELAALQGRS